VKGQPIPYSATELAWIEARAHLPRRQLHTAFLAAFNRHDVSQANLTSLCKRRGWLTGRTGRFAPGHTVRGGGNPDHPNAVATRFRKGNRPHTYRGPGHETVDPKDGYVWIIVAETNPHTGAPTRRVMKHRWLWEKANGPVPEGHALKCLDGNRQNTDPDNWIAVPRAILPRLTGRWRSIPYDSAPDELKPILLAVARLEYAAQEAKRKRA
jgi:hypothetical protein